MPTRAACMRGEPQRGRRSHSAWLVATVFPTRARGQYVAPGGENWPGSRDGCGHPEDYWGRFFAGTLAHGMLNQVSCMTRRRVL